jgi:lipopolysaccharide cholinephosphotransferase
VPAAEETLTPQELRRVQLGVLVELDRLCRAEGLVYYLAYGTLLGAVRNGGFIPWDDDVDVMMPREDYQRLVARFAVTAPSHLTLGSPQTQAGWPLPYAKVSDDRTVLREPFEVPVELGVNVDVFPLDALPSSRLRRRAQALELRFLDWALELRYIAADRGRAWHRPVAIRVAKPLLRLVPMEALVRAVERAMQRTGRRPSERRAYRLGRPWSVPTSSLAPASEVRFEGVACLAPADRDAVLSAMYGDWRTLPPEGERVSHHAFTAAWRTLHRCPDA